MIIAGKTPNDKKKIKDTAKKVAKKVVKKSEYFDDGYDFGDVTKTILSTTGDVASNVAKGFVSTVEGTVDTGRILLGDLTKASANAQAKVWDYLGNKAYANSLRNAGQQIKDYEYKNATVDVTGTLLGENNTIFNKNWSKELHEKSVAGDLTTSVAQGVGNMGAFVGLGAIGGGSPALTFTNSFSSAFGNTMTNALRNGLTEKEARGQAFTSGMAEALSEQFFQGIPGLKTAGWADNLISKPVEKYFGGKTGKIALRILDSLGEGYEEELSNVLQATFEGIRNGKNVKDIFNDAKAQSFFNSAETREAFISALISSALTNGGTMIINNSQKNSIIKSYAQEHGITEQQTRELFDSIVEKRANLEDATNFKERTEIEEGISKQLRNEIKQDIKGEKKLDLNELFEQTPNSRKEMQFRFNQDEAKNVKSEKQNILANDMARLNDEKSNHELYKVVNAIQSANDTQQYHITTTEGLYEMGIVNKNENGEYTMPDGSPYVPRGLNYKNGEIYINADVGSQSGTQAVYHEMFEGFKKAAPKQYNEFKQMVTDIIGEENIQKEFDTYKSMYGEELTDDIRDEIINDKFGELAENQNFINKISANRNVLEKFIDAVKNMIKYVKGTDEERQLMKLQKNLETEFAKRYKETDFSKNNAKGETKLSLQEQAENQAKKLTEQDIANRQQAREDILNYIADNNIENPTVEDMINAIDDYNAIDNAAYDSTDYEETLEVYRDVAQEIYDERNNQTKYSLEKINRAKEEIGTTTDLREAGYLTADGEYLDFSGKKHGGQPGRRSMDHREIADIYTDEEYDNAEKKYPNLGTATAIMQDFIEEGNIRLMPEQGIDIAIEPTDAQYDKLADYIDFVKDKNGEIYIDVDKTGTGNYGSTYYSANTPTSKIIRDIKEYFKTGTYPEQSDMAQFYSLTKNDNIDSKEIAPIGTTTDETITPIREDISNLSNQLNNLSNQIQTLQNGVEMTSSEDIAPVNPYRERAIAQREANKAIDEMQKDENYWKSLEQIANEEGMSALDDKSARKLSRNIGKELGLKQKQVKDLQNVINDAFNNGYSLDQIKEELYNKFGHDSVTMKNEEAIVAQQQIKDYKIKVSPEIQKDIADYGYWKQQYFGKIKLSNEGSPVDVVYGQLSEQNPAMFPSDIWNPTDQLLRIAEVADMDKKYSMDYEMNPETINEAANYIHDTFNETLYANAMKSQTDLELNAMQYNENLKEIPVKKKTRQEVRENLQNTMGITKQDLQVGKDIKSFDYQLTTPERVNEKVFGREIGKKINEQTVEFAKHQEAERIRFLNKERQEIADLGIKARSKESALVQQYGEGIIDDFQLAQEVSDKATQEKIKNAARVLRSKYDTYLDMINEELVDMGYDPIPKRKDYMRHFQELTDKFSQTGIPFNRQDLNAENLPTDINGLTEFNVPGKSWFASAQRRTGEQTTYDAITGIDGYLEGSSNLMYHTETIQRYRALEKLIRDTYGQQHGLDEFNGDISSEEAMQRIQDIQEGKLSNYAAWIKEQANAIAGKKGAIDRGFERALGRKAYTVFNTIKKQTGSNMTGFNVRSALTNFISSTIAAAKTNKMAMIKGTIDTINNMFHDDGFINKSDFLTSRFGSDSLSQKTWQKISNAGQIFMKGSDWFTSNLITRSKYYEGIQKGMTETQAMNYANDFAARVMGDRSKGATAEAFNSKTLGILTQFQLETNNQWQYMIHDTKMEYQENLAKNGGLKAGATVLFQMGQLAAYSYLFNEMFEQLTGSRAAFDIADIFKKLFGLGDDDKDKDFETRMKEAGKELVDALPFASLFGSGGRLPISEMLTPFQTTYDYITGGTNKYGQDITLKDVGKETLETLPYYLLPTGYGQLKKAKQGLGMYSKDLPTPGSYTDSGNLRFTADTDTASVIKNALFGQWSGEEAKKYRESGYKTIRANNIQEMLDLGMNSSEYREYKEGLTKSGSKNSDKIDYINNLDATDEQKNIMAENVLKRDTDMSNYGNYGSYEEFDYAYKNPTKYKTMVAIANNYQNYQDYIAGIDNVRDKYSQAKGYTTEQRKKKVAKYVNSLDLTIPQKAMLMRQYYSSFNNYNKEIVNYVSSLDMEYDEKVEILKVLKMKVDKNGNVSW